jgi:hypothetical protein
MAKRMELHVVLAEPPWLQLWACRSSIQVSHVPHSQGGDAYRACCSGSAGAAHRSPAYENIAQYRHYVQYSTALGR